MACGSLGGFVFNGSGDLNPVPCSPGKCFTSERVPSLLSGGKEFVKAHALFALGAVSPTGVQAWPSWVSIFQTVLTLRCVRNTSLGADWELNGAHPHGLRGLDSWTALNQPCSLSGLV